MRHKLEVKAVHGATGIGLQLLSWTQVSTGKKLSLPNSSAF